MGDAVGSYFRLHVRAVVGLRLHILFRHAPLRLVRAVAWVVGIGFFVASPELRRGLQRAVAICFPHLSRSRRTLGVVRYLANLSLYICTVGLLPYLSARQFERWFEYASFAGAVQRFGNVPVLLAATHFFNGLLGSVVGEVLHRAGVRLCGTFSMSEMEQMGVNGFLDAWARRYHWDEHLVVNVSSSAGASRASLISLQRFIQAREGWVMMFSDFLFRRSPHDVRYRVGRGQFVASGGVKQCLIAFPDATVIPLSMRYASGRLRLVCGEPLSVRDALESYYDEVLPAQIEGDWEQWQLWYLAPLLLDDPSVAAEPSSRSAPTAAGSTEASAPW